MKTTESADYDGFSLVSGGLIYSLTSVFRGKNGSKRGLDKTAIALMFITWVPVLILALLSGTLNDDQTTISFFEDFLFHIRFLIVVPFLILIEGFVDKSFVSYVIDTDLLIPDVQQPKFNKLVKRLDKLTDSYLPEIFFLVVTYAYIIIEWETLSTFNSGRNYLSYQGTYELNATGWYYLLVSNPIFQLLIFRWIWRWGVWAYSVISISRYKLITDPLHADRMAGLSFTNLNALKFSFILAACSMTIAAWIGIEIVYHDKLLKSFFIPIILYLATLTVIIYAPLLSLMPFLFNARSYGVRKFGSLIRRHNIDYVNKWIENSPQGDEKILGALDNSSLADINGSYDPVGELKLIPIQRKMLILSLLVNALPFIPLVFTYYSLTDLLNMLTTSVLGR